MMEYGADAFHTTNTATYYTEPGWTPEGNEDQGQKNNDSEEDSGGFLGLISKWLQKGKK